jgi:hypothetical protein
MTDEFAHRSNVFGFFRVAVECEALGYLPYEDLAIVRSRSYDSIIEGTPRCLSALCLLDGDLPYQSVSRTGAVCPRKSGICSGSLPFSFTGTIANAPPPLASQLTDRYSGFA